MLNILEQVVNEGRNRDYSFLDAVLQYLPGQDAPQKVQPAKEIEESVLEAELEESIEAEEKGRDDLALLRYHHLPQDLMQDFGYGQAANDLMYNFALSSDEEEYEPPKPANDNYETASSPDEEAREKLQESKYEFLESSTNVNYEEKQKLAWWIKFNPALFTFLESFYNLSRDVDYRTVA